MNIESVYFSVKDFMNCAPFLPVPHRNAQSPAACLTTTVPHALQGRAARCHSCRRRMYHLRQELTAEALSGTLSIGEKLGASRGQRS